MSHARQAQERIQEFSRLKRARHLLDAISVTNELLADGSDVEILSLTPTIIKRLKFLGVFNTSLGKNNTCLNRRIYKSLDSFSYFELKIIFIENFNESTAASIMKPHTGIYHCCTFCSSGGKKEAICGCGGTMPGNIINQLSNMVLLIQTAYFK